MTIGARGESAEAVPAASAGKSGETPVLAPSVVGMITESKEEIREILAVPKVRRLALEIGVDLKTVKGSGPQGRITEEDVKAAKALQAAPREEKKQAIKIKEKFDFYGELERIPLRGVRRATAKRMADSARTAAHVTHMDEADVTALSGLRESLKVEAESKGVKLTYLPFLVKAVVAALKLHPMFNATFNEEDDEIVVKKYYNIGIAVDVPDGLIVPVVKGAYEKTVFEVAADIQILAEAARKRTLDLADLKGGTFSITNVGMIGGEAATPIINYPEVAILATLRIKDRARIEDGAVKVKKTLPLCLSFDHRVVDGAEAARFMNDLIRFIEDPAALNL
jgi:pyruvate dehydrogenase E2 component (dihydrolipoamide acetyltransferase)